MGAIDWNISCNGDDCSVSIAFLENNIEIKKAQFMCSKNLLPEILTSLGMDSRDIMAVSKKFNIE